MSVDKMKALKDKGNKAFTDNRLDEAFGFYSEAIELAKSSRNPTFDNLTLASLLSNRAQVRVKQKKYEEALVDANKSLEVHPLLKKSLISRAAINCELNHFPAVIVDLRKVFQFEPRNVTARLLMRRALPPVKMNVRLYETYIHYVFRRGLFKLCTFGSKKFTGNRGFKMMLFRQLFVSADVPKFMHKYISGSKITQNGESNDALFILSHWFTIIRRKYEASNYTTNFIMSKKSFQAFIKVVRPASITFIVTSDSFVKEFGPLYGYSGIFYHKDVMFAHLQPSPADKKAIERNSNFLTRIAYFDEIVKFEDQDFENADTLLVPKNSAISKRFLQLWKKNDWAFEELIFTSLVSNLASFEKFGGVVSEELMKVFIPIDDNLEGFGSASKLERLIENLQQLKVSFPELDTVVVTFEWTFTFEKFSLFFADRLKGFIAHLAAIFDKRVRPPWCSQLKVLANFNVLLSRAQLCKFDFKLLHKIVAKCRDEMEILRAIRCCGSSNQTFNWDEAICYFAAIKMETKNAQFQITFTQILKEFETRSNLI